MVSGQRLWLAQRSRTFHTGTQGFLSSLPPHNGSPGSRTHTLPAAGGTKQLCHGVAAEGRDMCRAVGCGDIAILTEVLSIIFNTGQRESRHVEGGCVKGFLRELGEFY